MDIAENIFAGGIYPWLSQGINMVTGLLPFSLMELEIILVPFFLLILIFRFFYGLIFRIGRGTGDVGYYFCRGILNLTCGLGFIFFCYTMLAGVNYYRYSFAYYSGLEIQESTVDELYELSSYLATEAYELREELIESGDMDEGGVLVVNSEDWKNIYEEAKNCFITLSEKYRVLNGNYSVPKPVYFSTLMSRMEITGIFWPFTAEANVNMAVTEYSIPATMCHELAHLRGFMREDEANFIAYLACKKSEQLEFQYSGVMMALSYTMNQLYQADYERYQVVRSTYHEGMNLDLRASYYYWKQFEDTTISTVSNTVNDTYLKANNQNDGVKSYGRMVDLLLAEYRNR